MTTKKKSRVLAIDDEPSMIEWLKILLEHEGYEVRTAMIGTRGEEIFRTWKPDVVVTDLDMPEQDGFHFVASLRADSAHADIPVIALASGVNRDAIEHGRKLRISDFVAKFDRSGLLAALAGTQDALGEAA